MDQASPDARFGWLGFSWIGCTSNGEGLDEPHGPYGSLHLVVRRTNGLPQRHWYIPGPTPVPNTSKMEWLSFDEKSFKKTVGDIVMIPVIYEWEAEQDEIVVEVWESDPMLHGPNANWPRGHDYLFSMQIDRQEFSNSKVLPMADPKYVSREASERLPDWVLEKHPPMKTCVEEGGSHPECTRIVGVPHLFITFQAHP